MSDTHIVTKDQRVFAFDRTIPPVLEVDAPSTISFEVDNLVWSRLERGDTVDEIGIHNFNALAGPVYIKGAEAGNVLKVEVLNMEIASAWSCWLPNFGRLRTDKLHLRQIPIENERCIINEKITVPLDPMIGCIGVAPAEGTGSTVFPAYSYGGNMDIRELRIGSTIYLPVQVDGALLSVGDYHAAMGSGETTAVSLEANGSATVRISVEKNMQLDYPRMRVGNETLFIAPADNFADARLLATKLAYDYLTDELGLEPFDAYAYISACVDLRFGGPASAIVIASVPDI